MGEGSAVSRSRVGNDVMDLLDPRCDGRQKDDPLLDRILIPHERDWMDRASSDEMWLVRLWALWASKEAAFKVYCKLAGPRAFQPRSFLCNLDAQTPPEDPSIIRIAGDVEASGHDSLITVEGSSNQSYVHVIGWDGAVGRPRRTRLESGVEDIESEGPQAPLDALRSQFTPEEWVGVHSVQSAQARLLARERVRVHLSEDRGREELPTEGPVEIRTSGDRPGKSSPQIWFAGRPIRELDLSLSHHGRFVAWALLIPTGG